MLRRAKTYYEAFMARHEAWDLARTKAVLSLKQVRTALTELGADTVAVRPVGPKTTHSGKTALKPGGGLSSLVLISRPPAIEGVESWTLETRRPRGSLSAVACSGDARHVAVAGQWGVVRVFSTASGKQRWKVNRDEVTSWSTPIFVEYKGRLQVVVSATKRIRGYDLATGDVIWECGGLSHNVVASPVSADGMVYAGSSYGKQAMLAIRLDGAKGDVTGTDRVAWAIDRYTPYVPSPLLYGGRLYFLRHYQGILSCLKARSGDVLYGPARLPGIRNVYASPVAAAGRVYITSRRGVTLVLKHGDEPEILAENLLDDRFSASAALVGDEIYLRGEQHLYCIGVARTDNRQPTTRATSK